MRTVLAPLTLTIAVAALLAWSPGHNLRAQQEPNRQLVQNGSATTSSNKRIALVIGNGAYTSAPPLKNPPNDARDMAATLRALGFDVTSGINANQRDMKRLIREFGQKLKAGGSGLFYYAGHGVQSKGRNYLIPVDADIQSEVEAEDAGVDVSLVLGYMDDAQNGLNIVILDACRNNPFARSFRSASNGLAQVDAPTGTLIAYATAPGRVASDGTGQNGLYTSELLEQMRVPGLSATEMFMRVRAEVMKQTTNKQVPWEASSLVGTFYFSGPKNDGSTTSLPANEVKVDPMAFELSYWETIKNSTNADDFKSYLEKYPNGQFAALAKNRIATLEAPAKPAESKPAPPNDSATELAFWDAVKNSTSAADYRAYLQKYPNGAFVELAKNRLAPLEAAERERAKGNEITRANNSTTESPAIDSNAKVFPGYYGIMSAGFTARAGKLVVSPAGIQIVWNSGKEGLGELPVKVIAENPPPFPLPCSSFAKARTEDDFIREISQKPDALAEVTGWGGAIARFKAASPADATAALAAIRAACSVATPTTSMQTDGGSNTLEGTTWSGASSGGDKHYEFTFLANEEVVWNLRWNGNKSYKGTWRKYGNTITMDFRPWWTDPVMITITGNQMNGSWAKGQYTFTLTRHK